MAFSRRRSAESTGSPRKTQERTVVFQIDAFRILSEAYVSQLAIRVTKRPSMARQWIRSNVKGFQFSIISATRCHERRAELNFTPHKVQPSSIEFYYTKNTKIWHATRRRFSFEQRAVIISLVFSLKRHFSILSRMEETSSSNKIDWINEGVYERPLCTILKISVGIYNFL